MLCWKKKPDKVIEREKDNTNLDWSETLKGDSRGPEYHLNT